MAALAAGVDTQCDGPGRGVDEWVFEEEVGVGARAAGEVAPVARQSGPVANCATIAEKYAKPSALCGPRDKVTVVGDFGGEGQRRSGSSDGAVKKSPREEQLM